MDRKDLLKANAAIFEGQGKALDQYASRHVKILVVGNPANTNALITRHFAPSLPSSAFTAMTRLDQNRAQAQIAKRVGVSVGSVKNVTVWGNHSNTQYPDVSHAQVVTAQGVKSVTDAVGGTDWLQGDFIKVVQSRGAAIIDALKKSSAASAANAAVEHVRDWVLGTKEGEWVSDGSDERREQLRGGAGAVLQLPRAVPGWGVEDRRGAGGGRVQQGQAADHTGRAPAGEEGRTGWTVRRGR